MRGLPDSVGARSVLAYATRSIGAPGEQRSNAQDRSPVMRVTLGNVRSKLAIDKSRRAALSRLDYGTVRTSVTESH